MKTFLGFTAGALTGLLAGAATVTICAIVDGEVLDDLGREHRQYYKRKRENEMKELANIRIAVRHTVERLCGY